ncbi:hypothetical protein AALA21_07305 [Eggerthellaceae bacterium 3-80]|nr:hypothetical protein D7W09_06950 [bacterium D16-34]
MSATTDCDLNRRIIAVSRFIGSFFSDDSPACEEQHSAGEEFTCDTALRHVAKQSEKACSRLAKHAHN